MKYILLLLVLSFPLKAMSQFAMPIGGEQGKDWFIWSYMDDDTTAGSVSNFKCSQYVYDNWHGLIFVLKNMQLMDEGIPVIAAAPGKIVTLHDGYDDRTKRSDSGNKGNYIRIQHSPNLYTFYAYLKNHSMLVKLNQTVKKGDTIAFVGSTGQAYQAKLYFRAEDALDDKYHDPLGSQCTDPPQTALLSPGPVYDTSFGFIDGGITNHRQYSSDTLIERPPTLTEISVTDDSYADAWFQFKNIFTGDNIEDIWTDPHGTVFRDNTVTSPSDQHFGHWSGSYPTYLLDTGLWSVQWLHNGDPITTQTFRVVTQHSGVPIVFTQTNNNTFPLPANDHITVTNSTSASVKLFNIDGIEFPTRFEVSATETHVSWDKIPDGVYYLEIKELTGEIHRSKIMVLQ